MKKFKLSITIILLTSLLISCEGSILEPEIPAGRRDYTIVVDTIDMQPLQFNTVWGSSMDNLWAGGYKFWNYNGSKWSSHFDTHAYGINAINGLSESNIWAVNHEGHIYHYDGLNWELNYRHGPDGNNPYFLADIWIDSPNNVYAVGGKFIRNGLQGIVLKYSSGEWKEVEIDSIKTFFRRIKKGNAGSKYYLIGNNVDLTYPDSSRIFELNGTKLKEIYLGEPFKESQPHINVINGNIYFSFNKTIHKYWNNQFIPVRNIDHPDVLNFFYGRSLNDLILPTAYGIMHYDGRSIEYIYKNPSFFGYAYHVFNNGFVAVGFDRNSFLNLIVRGTLK